MKKFTIFTPTYNRGNLLKNLYESLRKQSFKDFEWIIVDDGSTENTKEIVNSFLNDKILDIKYFYQDNGGKHRAYNKGIEEAKGEFFICIDSDDYIIDNALDEINNFWMKLENKTELAGLGYLTGYSKNDVIGTKFPKDMFISNHFDIYHKFDVKGDKSLIFRTELLKDNKFPEIYGEKFLTEAILYHRITRDLKIVYINEIIEIKKYYKNGLTDNYFTLLAENPKASILYFNEMNHFAMYFTNRMRINALYVKYSLFAGLSFFEIIKNAHNKIFAILAYPRGIYRYIRAKIKLN